MMKLALTPATPGAAVGPVGQYQRKAFNLLRGEVLFNLLVRDEKHPVTGRIPRGARSTDPDEVICPAGK